ncbi:cytochrome oxidase putative small subunit CydP [Legionella hackeliae]|uniref:cytochrome oxidase putative small subunit CydP n=1 Tax=Legionella hackeliae TaxID=449 RepID=UPI00073CF19F|nr:cytochrome oxidase putative small subunit CydP [Legionella hackeliae]KTD10484.1 hypothetical protein Lhac_2852 [Legionella hackeliae]STX49903.1 Uncharacterised protein [Legionella hackeliae]
MKPLTRDILLTLSVKFALFFLLWFVCFKDVEKPAKDMRQWLLGSSLQSDTTVTRTKP